MGRHAGLLGARSAADGAPAPPLGHGPGGTAGDRASPGGAPGTDPLTKFSPASCFSKPLPKDHVLKTPSNVQQGVREETHPGFPKTGFVPRCAHVHGVQLRPQLGWLSHSQR